MHAIARLICQSLQHCTYNESWLNKKTKKVWHLLVCPFILLLLLLMFYKIVFVCRCHVDPNGFLYLLIMLHTLWAKTKLKNLFFGINKSRSSAFRNFLFYQNIICFDWVMNQSFSILSDVIHPSHCFWDLEYTLLPFHLHDHWNSWMSVFVRYFRSILRFWRFICTSIVNSWVHKAVLLHFHTPPPPFYYWAIQEKKKQTGGRLSKYFLEPPGVFHFFTLRLTPPLEIP